jgi:hypothetical protein
VTPYGLGRLPYQDPRSRNFALVDIESRPPRSYTWAGPPPLNQFDQPECVGFSWAGELGAKPVVIPVSNLVGRNYYNRAQAIDRAEGRHWEAGASVLAGAKAVQAAGHMPEYRWAFGVGQFATGVSRVGPGVVGVDWHAEMMEPDGAGYIHPAGTLVGGHAIFVRGYSVTKRRFLLQNSWGPGWGGRAGAPPGCCWLSHDDLGELLSRQWADACLPMRRAR